MQSIIVFIALLASFFSPLGFIYLTYDYVSPSPTIMLPVSILSVLLIFPVYTIVTWVGRLIFFDTTTLREHHKDCFDPFRNPNL